MNINQKALELLENNQYNESLKLFQEAVNIFRGVQSLTNLAWIYCNEEYDDTKALDLLEEAVKLNPSSHFPYNLLGEVYIRQQKWKHAKDILLKSISIHPTKTAYNNLGVTNYHLGNLEDAATYFLKASKNSDYAMYSYVKCLIELGKTIEPKLKLDTFSEKDDDFVGEVDLADMYVELGCYKEAINWFEKGWELYWKQPYWISRYVYSLMKLNNTAHLHQIFDEAINQTIEEIKETYAEECEEHWSETDKQSRIKDLLADKDAYERMFEKISSGYFPSMKFNTSIQTECYLFGCTRHNNPNYQE